MPNQYMFNLTGLTSLSGIGQFFYILLLVAFVSLLAFYSTRLIANAKNRGGLSGGKRNLQIVETIGVGVNAFVQIIRAGDKFFLLGVTKERVSLLTELDESQINIPDSVKNVNNVLPFGKVLSKFMGRETEHDENND